MKAGLIGNGYHSKRIQKILKKKNINFFLYKPSRPNYYNIEDFKIIKKCDVIFIITPNKTHLDYIKKLYSKELKVIKYILIIILDFQKYHKFWKKEINTKLEN